MLQSKVGGHWKIGERLEWKSAIYPLIYFMIK